MSENVKEGLVHKEQITQKQPRKTDESTQRPQAETKKVDSCGRKGSFTMKR